jgi:hypothetical protein
MWKRHGSGPSILLGVLGFVVVMVKGLSKQMTGRSAPISGRNVDRCCLDGLLGEWSNKR